MIESTPGRSVCSVIGTDFFLHQYIDAEASTVIARETSKNEFHRKVNVFKCFYFGLEGHRQAECRKRIADERPWNSLRFRRSVRDETPVSRSSRIQPINQRHVRFEDSTHRRFPPVSQRNYQHLPKPTGPAKFSTHRGRSIDF
ncbi:hypothetical protein TNCV_2907341 [Trichonephila clavipes]|nr:hypothetical protein TNCV_2907341 [Trichonephila clavipes]